MAAGESEDHRLLSSVRFGHGGTHLRPAGPAFRQVKPVHRHRQRPVRSRFPQADRRCAASERRAGCLGRREMARPTGRRQAPHHERRRSGAGRARDRAQAQHHCAAGAARRNVDAGPCRSAGGYPGLCLPQCHRGQSGRGPDWTRRLAQFDDKTTDTIYYMGTDDPLVRIRESYVEGRNPNGKCDWK